MSRLLIAEPPLQVLPTLACKIGLNEAIVLQQIHYWLDTRLNKNFYEGRLWVHNSLKSWLQQFPFFSSKTLQRTLANLENKQLLFVGNFHKNSWDRTKWYSINYDTLESLETPENPHYSSCGQNDHMHMVKVTTSTETECLNPYSQSGHMDRAKVTSSYIEQENTSKTTKDSEIQNYEALLQEELIAKAFSLWQEKIGCRTKLTPQRSERLRHLVLQELAGDLTRWAELLTGIARTPFLMGINSQKWRITLEWILKLENYVKVRDGHYEPLEPTFRVNVSDSSEDTVDYQAKINTIFQALKDSKVQHFVKNLQQTLGNTKFVSWFEDVVFSNCDNQIHLECSSNFKAEYLLNNFSSQFRQAYQAAGFEGVSIQSQHKVVKEFRHKGVYSHAVL